LVVVGFTLLLPVALLLAVGYYVAAIVQGVWAMLGFLTGRKPPPLSEPLPGPHLLAVREQVEGPANSGERAGSQDAQ
jgi:hypothetical protein